MTNIYTAPTIDEYLRKRLMPVEGTIPHVEGIEMYGNSIPAGTVGGDLFEYINFQQRYDIDARIQRVLKRSKQYLEPLPAGAMPRNSVDDHVKWLKSRPGYKPEMESAYSEARSSKQVRVAEDLRCLPTPNSELLSETRAKLHLLSVEKGRSSTNNQQASLINVPFFIAGTLRIIYDLFFYIAFVAVRRPEEAR